MPIRGDRIRDDVSFDADRANAYPWVSWRADVMGMVGTPFATSVEAFAHARKD